MQRYTEQAFNYFCAQLLESRGDHCYGPFVMPRALIVSDRPTWRVRIATPLYRRGCPPTVIRRGRDACKVPAQYRFQRRSHDP
jgi:hypothetical protein